MKVVFTHTDFRIYWPARLEMLHKFLNERDIALEVIEIAGSGSPYGFAGNNKTRLSGWHILFPDQKMEEIPPLKANEELRKMLDVISPDIVFAGALAFPSGAASVRWAVENKRRVVIFDNARLIDTPRSVLVNFVKKKIYSCVDAIFCPSKAWNETYSFFGIDEKQIFYGVNVVDNAFWQNPLEIDNGAEPHPYFLTVSRQISKKNLMFLMQSYSEYAKSVSDPIALVLVGEGPERYELENFALENELEQVQFIPFLSQDKLKDIYKNALCYILPSLYGETWGLTVNEAMATGLPVIVSDQAGCSSTLVRDYVNGYLVSPDNKEYLAKILVKIHEMPEKDIQEMGEKSRQIISEWGLDRFCEGVYAAVKFVTSQKRRKTSLFSILLVKAWKGRYRPI